MCAPRVEDSLLSALKEARIERVREPYGTVLDEEPPLIEEKIQRSYDISLRPHGTTLTPLLNALPLSFLSNVANAKSKWRAVARTI